MTTLLTGTDVSVDQDATFTTSDWAARKTVMVTAAEDTDVEADEAVTLTHTASGGGYDGVKVDDVVVTVGEDDTLEFALTASPSSIDEDGGVSTVTVSTGGVTLSEEQTITDDDEPSFTVTVSSSSIAEAGGVSTVTVSTGGVTFTADRQIALALSGTATKGADYRVGLETLTLTSGETSVETTVTAEQDTVDEDGETIVVTAEGAEATVTITDDDEPSFAVTVSSSAIAEAEGASTVTVSTGGVTFVADREISRRTRTGTTRAKPWPARSMR